VNGDPLDPAIVERLARATHAAKDLCDVLWEALEEELSSRTHDGPRAQRVAELSERVADVSSTVAALACHAKRSLERAPGGEAERVAESGPLAPVESGEATPPPARPEPQSSRSTAVLVDELEELPTEPRARRISEPEPRSQPDTGSRQAPLSQSSWPRSQPQPRPLPWDTRRST
jgi:hypothetical protein